MFRFSFFFNFKKRKRLHFVHLCVFSPANLMQSILLQKKKLNIDSPNFYLAEGWTGALKISSQSKEIISHAESAAFAVIGFIETKADTVCTFCWLSATDG